MTSISQDFYCYNCFLPTATQNEVTLNIVIEKDNAKLQK